MEYGKKGGEDGDCKPNEHEEGVGHFRNAEKEDGQGFVKRHAGWQDVEGQVEK